MNISFKGVILFVSDVERLKEFYTTYFGFEQIESIMNEWVLLRSGAFELGLHKAGGEFSNISSPGSNNSKLIFDLDGDLISLHKKFREDNVAVESIRTWDDFAYYVFDGTDPGGNVFQVRAKKG